MVDTSNQEGREYNFADNEDIDNNYWTNRLLTWWSGSVSYTHLRAHET